MELGRHRQNDAGDCCGYPGRVWSSSRGGRSRGVLRPNGMTSGLLSSCAIKGEGPLMSTDARECRMRGAQSSGVGRTAAVMGSMKMCNICGGLCRAGSTAQAHGKNIGTHPILLQLETRSRLFCGCLHRRFRARRNVRHIHTGHPHSSARHRMWLPWRQQRLNAHCRVKNLSVEENV
jgi:hypothetical protein